jgi:hypothetical protein
MLTEDGQKKIKEDIETTKTDWYAMGKVLGAYVSDDSKEALKNKLANKPISEEQQIKLTQEINQLKESAKKQGYNVDTMTKEEKLKALNKLDNENETLSLQQKQLRDAIWLSGVPLSDDWNSMRDEHIENIVDSSVKDKQFWVAEDKWNKLTDSEKQTFLQNYSDENNKIIGNENAINVDFYRDTDGNVITDGRYGNMGGYNTGNNNMKLDNSDIIDFYETINTVTHEGVGHGYQDYVRENQEKYLKYNPKQKNDVKILDYSLTPKMWPGNSMQYDKDTTEKLYEKDPAEVDAWKVGDTTEDYLILESRDREELQVNKGKE